MPRSDAYRRRGSSPLGSEGGSATVTDSWTFEGVLGLERGAAPAGCFDLCLVGILWARRIAGGRVSQVRGRA